jgi:hypothetical protein
MFVKDNLTRQALLSRSPNTQWPFLNVLNLLKNRAHLDLTSSAADRDQETVVRTETCCDKSALRSSSGIGPLANIHALR